MEAFSFSKFTHLKSETIASIMEEYGKLDVTIKAKNNPKNEYTLLPKEKVEYLEKLEAEYQKRQKGLQWIEENKEAIREQNERIHRRGLFSDSIRRF